MQKTSHRSRKQLPPTTPIWRALQHLLIGVALTANAAHAAETEQDATGAQPTGRTGTGGSLPPIRVEANAEEEAITGPTSGYAAKRSLSGMKTDTPIIETPQSISVVTAERIEAIGATRLKEALAYTPGVITAPWGDDSQYDWIYIRGFDAYSPGFYKDGLQLRNSGSWGIWQTENYGAERIEIMRGPASVLYGQGGPGGIVNVVSKRPSAEAKNELQLQLGTNSKRQVAGDFTGPLNADGSLLYRLTGLVLDSKLSTGGLQNDRVFLAPSLTWKPSADTSLTLLSEYLRVRTGSVWNSYPTVGTLLPNPNGKVPVSTFTGERDFNRYNQDQWMVGYLFEHKANDTWTLRQNARYGRFKTDYRTMYEGDFVTVDEGMPSNPLNFRLMNRSPLTSNERAKSFVIDNQAQARWNIGNWQHTVLMGLDYQKTTFDVLAFSGGKVNPIDLYAPVYGSSVTLPDVPMMDSVSKLSQTGWYVQDQIKFGEHWVATLGGRYDSATVDTFDRQAGTRSRQTDNKFSRRAGLVYLAPNGWAPYLSYSEGFMPTTTVDDTTGKPFKPETSRQYEAGLRYQPPGRSDTYSAAVFSLQRRNYISFTQDFKARQTGEIDVRGLELEAVLRPIKRLNLIAAYTFTQKADVTASSNPKQIGKQLNAVPRNQFSAWMDYLFDGGVKVGLGVRYSGSTRGSEEAAPIKIPSTTLLDAMVSYDFNRWNLALHARNLTDKTYVANCNGAGANCSYGGRRSITGTATYRW